MLHGCDMILLIVSDCNSTLQHRFLIQIHAYCYYLLEHFFCFYYLLCTISYFSILYEYSDLYYYWLFEILPPGAILLFHPILLLVFVDLSTLCHYFALLYTIIRDFRVCFDWFKVSQIARNPSKISNKLDYNVDMSRFTVIDSLPKNRKVSWSGLEGAGVCLHQLITLQLTTLFVVHFTLLDTVFVFKLSLFLVLKPCLHYRN